MRVTLTDEEQRQYVRMVRLLHSLTYGITTKFVQDKQSRQELMNKLHDHASQLLTFSGCGDLCYDEEKGCISCHEVVVPAVPNT